MKVFWDTDLKMEDSYCRWKTEAHKKAKKKQRRQEVSGLEPGWRGEQERKFPHLFCCPKVLTSHL